MYTNGYLAYGFAMHKKIETVFRNSLELHPMPVSASWALILGTDEHWSCFHTSLDIALLLTGIAITPEWIVLSAWED